MAVAATLVAWFGFSFAGLPWLAGIPATAALLTAIALWLTLAITSRTSTARPRPRGWIVGGIILGLAITGIAFNLPVKARFAASAPSFERFVDRAGIPPAHGDDDVVEVACPRVIGLYAIDSCEVTDDGYLFFDPLGHALVDYAGFAYLPDGPQLESTAAFELQELVHLQGDWYAFAASW